MKRLLVTGRHGFVGSTIAKQLETEPALGGWQLATVPPDLDLRDDKAVLSLVRECAPDAVMHLAAQSWVPESVRDPEATLQVNLIGTLHLLQALRETGFAGTMLFTSTGDVYGHVAAEELPIAETRLPAPRNPYAVSKVAAEALCFQWSASERIRIVTARAFNHIGPGQSDRFVMSSFARQIAEIRLGRRGASVQVGDIDVTRDFTDVRDVVRAYFALLAHGEPGGIYNVCSGVERTVRSLLERLAALAEVEITIEQDPQRLRQSEQRRGWGDPGKIRRATGWHASTPIDESLSAMLHYWEQEVTNG